MSRRGWGAARGSAWWRGEGGKGRAVAQGRAVARGGRPQCVQAKPTTHPTGERGGRAVRSKPRIGPRGEQLTLRVEFLHVRVLHAAACQVPASPLHEEAVHVGAVARGACQEWGGSVRSGAATSGVAWLWRRGLWRRGYMQITHSNPTSLTAPMTAHCPPTSAVPFAVRPAAARRRRW